MTTAARSSTDKVLLHRGNRWREDEWRTVDDRVRGGASRSRFHVDPEGRRGVFQGTLDIETLGGAGFASQVLDLDSATGDFTGFDALVVDYNSEESVLDFTVGLKNEVRRDRGDGRNESAVVFEAALTASGRLAWTSFSPTYRGRPVEPGRDGSPSLDLGAVKQLTLLCRSNFGRQSGDFCLKMSAIRLEKNVGEEEDSLQEGLFRPVGVPSTIRDRSASSSRAGGPHSYRARRASMASNQSLGSAGSTRRQSFSTPSGARLIHFEDKASTSPSLGSQSSKDATRMKRESRTASSSSFLPPTHSDSTSSSDLKSSQTVSASTFAANKLTNVMLAGMLNVRSLQAKTTQEAKDPLSIQTTSVNFRKFVQKSGPVFWFQDTVESIIRWENPSHTLLAMSVFGLLCLEPRLLLLMPNVMIALVLLLTYQKRHPTPSFAEAPDPKGPRAPIDPLEPAPIPRLASEGSPDYLSNLQNIQNMMGMISDGYDAVVPFVPYINWSNEQTTLLILQFAIVSTFFIAAAIFLLPIPYKLIALIGGEAGFIIAHPLMQGFLRETGPVMEDQKYKLIRLCEMFVAADRLQDHHMDAAKGGPLEVHVFENERYWDGAGWGPNLLVGERSNWTQDPIGLAPLLGEKDGKKLMTPGKGRKWVEHEDWGLDWTGRWSGIGADLDGWIYSDDQWENMSQQPLYEEGPARSVTRRRRWTRRAYDA